MVTYLGISVNKRSEKVSEIIIVFCFLKDGT